MAEPLGKLALTSLAALMIAVAGAHAQDPKPAVPPRSFDYWQPDWMVRELWGPGRMPKSMQARLLRHTTFVQFGVPRDYQAAQSPLKVDAKVIAGGRALYDRHCASCHGSDGLGAGDASRGLTPSPALLAYMIGRPIAVDEYLLWSIADGGKQFDTEMPGFRDTLARDDIWRIIAYMRAGFPGGQSTPAR